jgi:hypothetical protein
MSKLLQGAPSQGSKAQVGAKVPVTPPQPDRLKESDLDKLVVVHLTETAIQILHKPSLAVHKVRGRRCPAR